MIWNNLSVARKLWGVVLGALAMMLALGVAVLVYVEHIDARSRQAIEAADARIGTTMQWKSLTELSTERFLVSATSTERHLVEEMALLSRQNSQQINGLQKQIEDSASEPQERALVQRLAANREQFREVAMGIFREREAGNTQAALALVQQRLRPTTSAYIGMLGELVGLQEQQRDAMAAQARQQRQRAYLAAGGATLALLCAGILLSALLVRSITRPLARAVALADAIAAGDLTQ
ncbi:HAMP domain-containing protein, partial [Oryzisolibacter propanilivorax]